MESNNKTETVETIENMSQQMEEGSTFDIRTIFTLVVLNWQWFLLSIFIFMMGALLYLRYTTPTYQMSAKMLIKEETNNRRNNGQMLANMQDFGFLTNSAGIENEVEILQSRIIALEAVKDLKLYTEYYTKGKIKNSLTYKCNPFNVDVDPEHLEIMNDEQSMFVIKVTYTDNTYQVKGMYIIKREENPFSGSFKTMPAVMKTPYGTLTFTKNTAEPTKKLIKLKDGDLMTIRIYPPKVTAAGYAKKLSVAPTSKMTSIAQLTLKDKDPQRAYDYLAQLALCYNRQANADKNEIAYKTEEFINSRLEKINDELGLTEGQLENYKKRNNLIQLRIDAQQTVTQSAQYYDKLTAANMQIQLLDYLREYINEPENRYELVPSNVGLTDNVSSTLINEYNKTVQERNRLLVASSENAPQVLTLTATLDRLSTSIKEALVQARRSADIQRQSVQQQYDLYQSKVANSPEQERILTQIGRQQEVKSGLYLMLLQKREENSISLAATADKGKMIDEPIFEGKVSPKSAIILLAALVLGFAIPLLFSYLIQILRYKIEGHEDVAKLTTLPIVADVAVANENAKSAAGIVVHENKNNQTDEIFRSMRTNIQFMMKKEDKVILFTSSTSGEGKTFNAANLSVSFALLGKKVILLGLDIRKPALGRLFNITDRQDGITTLLVRDKVTKEDVKAKIRPSGVNANLDLLLAGPTPPNPTELLARETLGNILNILKEDYDYIILDTAPVGLVTDTLQIGRFADVTAFVCRADYTPKSSFNLVNTLSKEEKLPNMCVVINGIDMSRKKYGYYYGYGKYGRYGRYGYGRYSSYGNYGSYGYGYGNYTDSHYGNKDDDSIKR